jgi:hypothetical protein
MAITKSVNETIILVPVDIPFEYRDRYAYQWKYKHACFSTDYEAHFIPFKSGDHPFKLVTTDKSNGLRAEKDYLVHVIGERKKSTVFGITCIYNAIMSYEIGTTGDGQNYDYYPVGIKDVDGGFYSTRMIYDARDYDLEYSSEVIIPSTQDIFPPIRDHLNKKLPSFLPIDAGIGWHWEHEELFDKFPSEYFYGPKKKDVSFGANGTIYEFYTDMIEPGDVNLFLRALILGVDPEAINIRVVTRNHPHWDKLIKQSPKSNMLSIISTEINQGGGIPG